VLASICAIAYGSWAEYCASYNGSCELREDVLVVLVVPRSAVVVVVEHVALLLRSPTVPYPFLTLSSFPCRCGIYVGATGLALAAFWGFNRLHT
jgi:hypothetical protein